MMKSSNYFQKLNANRKKWRIIRERAAAKQLREEGIPPNEEEKNTSKKKAESIYPGDVYDKLTVIEQRPSKRGYAMALFRCSGTSVDCAEEVVMRVSSARYNLKKSGWCSCAPCYHAAGGAGIIWKQKAVQKKTPQLPTRATEDEQSTAIDLERLVKQRVVAFIEGRPSFVKITTLDELRETLKEPRPKLIKALLQAQADRSIERKRTRWATGYVLSKAPTNSS
jgi:hypothetical protein